VASLFIGKEHQKKRYKMLTDLVKKYIDQSVLCWLATSNKELEPNVSPKEIFTFRGDNTFLIANVASPVSINNIKENPKVCVSLVDVFVQKGYKLKGTAKLIHKNEPDFINAVSPLLLLFSDEYPITTVIEIEIKKIELIQAPSYFLYPERTEEFQIESAMRTYKVKKVTEN
jgi:uncharacterized protein